MYIYDFSVAVQRVLLDFGFKILFNKRLAFSHFYRDFYILLLASSKDHWVPRMFLFFKLIENEFLLTGTFN